jgi:hypothetical protein
MISESDIELAHAEAFDFVWGNLPAASRPDFDRHLLGCRYCQAIVDEYSEIGQIVKNLPPHVDPPAELEDRTVAAMVAAMGEQRAANRRRADNEDRAATRAYPIPSHQPPVADETQPRPIPPLHHEPTPEPSSVKESPAEDQPAQSKVTPLPVWRRHPHRLAAVVAVAAAIIAAAIVIPFTLGRGGPATTVAFNLTPPPGSAQPLASAAVTARQDASGSWALTMTVRHLKAFGDFPWYECWYVGTDKAGHQQVASAGTFILTDRGSRTFAMTSAVDPREFKTMQIRLEQPGPTGAIEGPVILTGSSHTA